jgi:hypothetical protein
VLFDDDISLSLFRSIDAFCGENETTTFFVLLFFCEKTKGFGVPFRKAVQKVKVVVIVTKEYNLYVVVTMNSLAVTLLHPLLPCETSKSFSYTRLSISFGRDNIPANRLRKQKKPALGSLSLEDYPRTMCTHRGYF